MPKINILHLRSNYAEEGGPETLILSIIRTIDPSRYGIIIASLRDEDVFRSSLMSEAQKMGVHTECIRWKRNNFFLANILKLRALIKTHDIRILHTHDLRTNFMGLFAARVSSIPCIASIHGWIDTTPKLRVHNYIDKSIIRYFDRIIVNSGFLKKRLLQLNIPERKIDTVYNAVNFGNYRAGGDLSLAREELGINGGVPLIATVGRLNTEKGHRLLLDAASEVLRTFPETILLIVGEGALEDELKRYTAELGLSDHVIFTGFYGELPRILNSIDLFVLPSVSEGLPLTILEAMAAGKPVIATDVGGVSEVIEDGSTGILIRDREPHALASAIISLLSDKIKAEELARKGQELVREKFSAETMVRRLETIYGSLTDMG